MMAKIDLTGYKLGSGGARYQRIPQDPSRNDKTFWAENGGVDDFRQVGWVSMNTGKVWGLEEDPPKNTPDMTPIFINVRGD